jgi:hypothetical protein
MGCPPLCHLWYEVIEGSTFSEDFELLVANLQSENVNNGIGPTSSLLGCEASR